jgi:phosphohistidine phosphatase SixA
VRRPEGPTRRAFAAGLPFLSLAPVLGAQQEPRQDAPAAVSLLTVVLVRHAEKDPAGDPKDPGLSESGRRRAEALAKLLSRSSVTHLYASSFRRTKETLAPIAAARSLPVEVVAAGQPADLVPRLRALPEGSVAVVAGHSNTLPAIVAALGGTIANLKGDAKNPMLGDDEYGRLFVVAFPRAPAEGLSTAPQAAVLELAYGE